jgi:hypothetical protein
MRKKEISLKVEIRKKKKREHTLLDMVQVAAAKNNIYHVLSFLVK